MYLGVQLVENVLVSGIQQSYSVIHIHVSILFSWWLTVKSLPANVGDIGLIPGSGRYSGEGNGNHSSILAWEIPWTEDSCCSLWGHKESHNLVTKLQHSFSSSFPFSLLQNPEQSSLCYTVGPCYLTYFFFTSLISLFLLWEGCAGSSLWHVGSLLLQKTFSSCSVWALGPKSSAVTVHGLSRCGTQASL